MTPNTPVSNALKSSADQEVQVDEDKFGASDRARLTHELFERIEATDDPLERDRLRAQVAELHIELVCAVASRYRGRGESDEDLRQAGHVGLMKAINGFRFSRGPEFLSYAVPTIAGEIKKYFRDCCWTIRPTRRVQELHAELAATSHQLAQDLGREPTLLELATELNEDPDTVNRAMGAFGCYSPRSLDAPLEASPDGTYAAVVGCEDEGFDHVEVHVMLASAVRDLPARDREILALRFFDDLTQRQIAAKIGVTQMQVSRLLTRIMLQLREELSTSITADPTTHPTPDQAA